MLVYLLYLFLPALTSSPVSAETPSEISQCSMQPYKAHIFSRRPLMIYIEDFVSTSEASQLISLAEPTYQPSQVVTTSTNETRTIEPDTTARYSESTALYSTDSPLVDCILSRAATFQGVSSQRMEPLQVVRYSPNGFFKHHYDWLSTTSSCQADAFCEQGMGDRESTFFVYLQADCTGGETEFTDLRIPEHMDRSVWEKFLDWDSASLKWKPRAGAALFWENLHEDGQGIREVLHAGLPVKEGSKTGLNIWTRERVPGSGCGSYRCEERVEMVTKAAQLDLASLASHGEL